MQIGPRLSWRMSRMYNIPGIQYTNHNDIYLLILAVDPENQGKGYGTKMLLSLLKRADDEKKAVYLETETERNICLYKKYKFQILGSKKVKHSIFSFIFMMRKPQ